MSDGAIESRVDKRVRSASPAQRERASRRRSERDGEDERGGRAGRREGARDGSGFEIDYAPTTSRDHRRGAPVDEPEPAARGGEAADNAADETMLTMLPKATTRAAQRHAAARLLIALPMKLC